MKNTPITARVKSGMFKTKEPLLNVGPAGVDGNNKTRTMPSPSKMKGYTMKSSPFKKNAADDALDPKTTNKDTESYKDGQVILGNETTVESAGDVIKGKEIMKKVNTDDYDGSGGYASDEDWNKFLGTDAGKRYTEENTKEVGTGTFEPDTQGDPVKVTTKKNVVLKEATKGDAQRAVDRRNNIRSSKITGRQKKRQTIKEGRLTDKLAGIDKEKNPGKYRRVKAKLQQATDRLGVATSEAENVANQSKQNIGPKGGKNRVIGADRDVTQGQRSEPQQRAGGSGSSFSNINTSPNTEVGFTEKKAGLNMFTKKSPMKMNYFKK
tara:strand:+ start:296 stop:1264 length:969 start_codon:yes stop_codon:yes gene_type:complete